MKTLKKFTTPVVEIKMTMTSPKDNDIAKGLFKVSEKSKKGNWGEEIAYYNDLEEAKKDMLNRINFWLR